MKLKMKRPVVITLMRSITARPSALENKLHRQALTRPTQLKLLEMALMKANAKLERRL